MGDKMIYQNVVLTAIALLLLALFIVIIIEIRLEDKRPNREPCNCEDCETEKEILKERLESKKFRMKYVSDEKLAELERKNERRGND